MTEKLKYKVGDKVLIEVEVARASSTSIFPYDIRFFGTDITGSFSSDIVEDNVLYFPPKPVVTQAVMDYYEKHKSKGWDVANYLDRKNMPVEIEVWLFHGAYKMKKQHALATLIAHGPEAVEVEKETKYIVRLVGLKESDGKPQYLFKDHGGNIMASWLGTPLTQKELEEDGFGDAFNNPLFEFEEVE